MLLKQAKGIVLSPHFLLAFPLFLPAEHMDNIELIWALHGSKGWWRCDRRAQGMQVEAPLPPKQLILPLPVETERRGAGEDRQADDRDGWHRK